MDADTRHHLKQNELLEALRKMKTLGDARTRMTLLFVALIAVAAASYYFWQIRRESSSAQGWQQLSAIVLEGTAEADAAALAQLRGLIAEQTDPGLVAMARFRLADGLIKSASADAAEREARLREAVELLSITGDAPGVAATLAAAAWLAQANAYESLREFENARASYGKLSEDARFEGQPFRELAVTRLESLDDITARIAFTPGEKPPPPPPLLAAPPSPPPSSAPASTPADSSPTSPAADSGTSPASAPSKTAGEAGTADPKSEPPASQPTGDPGRPDAP